jgi:D-alanyl-D-alanine carboxypeptidase
MTDWPSAGMTAAVVRGRYTLLRKGDGKMDIERGRAATANTVYQVGSITKQFTAAAVMQLVEQGRLSLADTLGTFLPGYPRWSALTIRQLLTHTAGIRDHTTIPALLTRIGENLSPDTILAYVKDAPLGFTPGTRYSYSNTGYLLLGRVLEVVTGRPYAELVRERFLTPFALRSTTFCLAVTSDDRALGYDLQGTTLRPAARVSQAMSFGAGGLCMSARDYLRWQTALTGGRVVSPASYALMSRSDTLRDGTATNYGFALGQAMLAGHRIVHHPGHVNGFSAEQLWLPDDSLRVVLFMNTSARDLIPLGRNLAAAALGLPPEQPERMAAVPLDPAQMGKYEGVYALKLASGATVMLRVATDSGVLTAQPNPTTRFPLIYLGDDTFGASQDPSYRLTIVFENGRAVKAIRKNAQSTVEGPRLP